MDLNQLYFEYQIVRMRGERAGSPHLRRESEREASLIAGRIGGLQHSVGANAAHCWDKLASAAPFGRPARLPVAANGDMA